METRCGGLLFTSKFDSGNLAKVEKVSKDEDEESGGNYMTGADPKADWEFNVWTSPDATGTPYENGNRSWFHFGIRGGGAGKLIKINIMNLNRQGKLYSQGHSPLVKTIPSRPRWERIRDRPTWEETNPSRRRSKNVENNFILSFTHRFLDAKGGTTYFAFCFPWSYAESQNQMASFDDRFLKPRTSQSKKDAIYYHRELLCHSLDKLRIDLITISSCHGLQDEQEPRFDDKLFPDKEEPRCKKFKNKRVYLVSSRVHPGETPASFVFNGFIDFILREDDPRAQTLRRHYVFKMIPMLNPDGVQRGHYRTDSRGVNLNRMYLDPDFAIYPSIYASKSLLVYHHVNNRVLSDAPGGAEERGASRCSGVRAVTGAVAGEEAAGDYRERIDTDHTVIQPEAGGGQRSKTYNVVYDNGRTTTTVVDAKQPGDMPPLPGDGGAFGGGGGSDSDQEHLLRALDRVSLHSEMSHYGAIESTSDTDGRYDAVLSSADLASGGECEDIEDVGPHIGNEGSDDEDDARGPALTEGVYAPHLADPKLLDVPPHESGVAFYVDLHAHASKRGCFIYGNYFDSEETHMENLLFPKLVALNTAHFDFGGCNFTERNMYLKDKREGLSKAGAGRVAIMKAIGITHSYTLECNYNTGRMVNSVPPSCGDNGRATPPPLAGFPPKYTMAHFEDVGKALAVAALDFYEWNPWSRLTLSEFCSLHGVREWVRRYIRGQRGLPRGPVNRPQKPGAKGAAGGQGQSPFIPRVALLAQQKQNANNSSQVEAGQGGGAPGRPAYQRRPAAPGRGPPGGRQGGPVSNIARDRYGQGAVVRREPVAPGNNGGAVSRRGESGPPAVNSKRELGPIKDVPRATAERSRRRLSASTASTGTSLTNVTMTASTSAIPHSAPQLHQSSSAPVTLSMTTAQSTDLKNLGKAVPPEHPRPFLQTHTPRKPGSTAEQHGGLATWPGLGAHTPRDSTYTVNAYGANYAGVPTSPPGAEFITCLPPPGHHPGVTGMDTESILSMEEEKVQQLRNIPNISGGHRFQASRIAKPLEPPNRTDPVKRKSKKAAGGKRRSASYSPQSAKGHKKGGGGGAAGSGTDSDAEKKPKGRRRKSWASKARYGSHEEEDDELADIFENNAPLGGTMVPAREKVTPSQGPPHPPTAGLPRPHLGRALPLRPEPSDTRSPLPPSVPQSGLSNKKGKKKKKWNGEKSSKHKLKSTSEVAVEEKAGVASANPNVTSKSSAAIKTDTFWIDL